SVEPEHPLGRAEFIRAELHDGSLAEAVQDSGADTVLHLRLALAPSHNGREDRTGNGVLGTMQLLAACQRSTTVRRLVVRSTVAVYDCLSEPGQSVPEATKARARKAARARLHEAMEAAKAERYVSGLARRRPHQKIAARRIADPLGRSAEPPI